MYTDMRDIAAIEDRQKRYSEITVDTYGYDEQEAAFEVYVQDGLEFPFKAIWRDPDEDGHEQKVTVLSYHSTDTNRGILLNVKYGKKQRRVEATQLYVDNRADLNGVILNDFRDWFENNHGYDDIY